MTTLPHIAERVLNRPLLVTREKLAVISDVLSGRIGIQALTPAASRFEGDPAHLDPETGRTTRLPYRRTETGVAVVSIVGSLVNRGAWIGANSGLVSYEGIGHQLAQAVKDPKAAQILLDIESPGGEAVGAFEIAALVRKANAAKPVTAVVNGMAASAAYAIASGARRIVSTESGISGSIGVVMLHADVSRKLDREGVTPTLIYAGDLKVDGNPFEPLADETKARLQGEVDQLYGMFVDCVRKGRAGLTAKAIRDTRAECFIGRAALAAGLVDEIGTFEDALRAAGSGRRQSRPTTTKRATMEFSQEDVDAARAEGHDKGFKAGRDAGYADGHKAGLEEGRRAGVEAAPAAALAERARIAAIIGDEEAKGRETQARALAFETDMAPAAAVAILKTGAKASTAEAFAERAAKYSAGVPVKPETPGAPAAGNHGWDDLVAKRNAEVAKQRARR